MVKEKSNRTHPRQTQANLPIDVAWLVSTGFLYFFGKMENTKILGNFQNKKQIMKMLNPNGSNHHFALNQHVNIKLQ